MVYVIHSYKNRTYQYISDHIIGIIHWFYPYKVIFMRELKMKHFFEKQLFLIKIIYSEYN